MQVQNIFISSPGLSGKNEVIVMMFRTFLLVHLVNQVKI